MTEPEHNLRTEIARLKAELAQVRAAPLPLEHIKARAGARLDRLAQRYLDAVDVAVQRAARAQKDAGVDPFGAIGGDASYRADFALGMLVHFHRDALLAEFMARVESIDTPPRLGAGTRQEKADKLARQLYAKELQDERRVQAGEADRRPDVDPRAALQLPEAVAFDPRVLRVLEAF